MNSQLLKGLVVLNTRPRQQQQAVNEAIAGHGGIPVPLPVLRIDPLDDEASLERIRSRIADIDKDYGLIFISGNAAGIGAELIRQCRSSLPPSLQVFAIGPATARITETLLQHKVLQPQAGSSSEDLLALPELQQVDGKSILIVRGKGGRETLRQTLEQRGARVDYLEVYSRSPEALTPEQLGECLQAQGVNAIIASSGEILQRLLELAPDNKAGLTLLPLIVPSARVAEQARQAGFQEVLESAGAADTALVAALSRIADKMS